MPACNGAIDGFNQLLSELSPPDWDKLCFHPRGLVPAQTLVSYAILEVCVHWWDIQWALEQSPHLPQEGLCIIVEHFSEYLHWTFLPDPDLTAPVRYRFRLTGAVPTEKDLVIEAQQARLADAEGKAVDASFRCGAEDFVLIMGGRTRSAQAIADGRLVAEDAGGLASGFSRWFQGL